jgi:hypothetical protein
LGNCWFQALGDRLISSAEVAARTAQAWRVSEGREAVYAPSPRHLIETTARPVLLHPRHRKRPLRSSTFAAGLRRALSSASGVNSAT